MIYKIHTNKYKAIMFSVIFIILLTGMKTYAAKYYHMERPRLAAELLFEHEEEQSSGPFGNSTNTNTTYSERLDIETSGWIYHPALAVYSFIFSPQWDQQYDQSDTSDKTGTNSFLQGYNAEVIFLQYKPYTITLRGNKSMTTISSDLTEKSKSESNTFGATLDLSYKVMPTSLEYIHSEIDQTGFFATNTVSDQVSFRSNYKKMGGHTNINASYSNNTQTTGSSISESTLKNARLLNTYDLPSFNKATLKALFALREIKSGFSERRVLTWSENLDVKHRKNLSSSYNLRMDGTKDKDSEDSLSQSIGYGLSHRLYENLTTGISVSGGKGSSTNRSQDTYRVRLNWDYVRKIPWGRISASTGHSYRVTDIRVESNLADVTEEPVVLTDPQGTFLANKHVDSSSIRVTRSNGLPYDKDIDYRTSEISSFTRITRIPSGQIPPGATVFVDYQYQTDPPFDYSQVEAHYGVRLSLWEVWQIYYNFSSTKQNFLRGIEPDTLSEGVSHLAGTELNWKWSVTKFEYLDRVSTDLSYERWNAEEAIVIKPTRNIFMSFSGRLGETNFRDTEGTESFYGTTANIQIFTSVKTKLSLNGFMDNTSGKAIDVVNTGFSSVFDWALTIYRGRIMYRFTEEKDKKSAETSTNHLISFVITRELF